MLIRETFINADDEDQPRIFGESEPYEPFTDNIKRLFLCLSRNYGRCVGKVYQDKKDGSTVACGWVFQKDSACFFSLRKFFREPCRFSAINFSKSSFETCLLKM